MKVPCDFYNWCAGDFQCSLFSPLYKRYCGAFSCARVIETRDGTRWDELTLFENRRKPVMLSQAYRASMARASCALCPSPPDTARGRNTSVIGCARALDTSCAKLKGVSASLRGFCQRCGASDNDLRGGATTSRRQVLAKFRSYPLLPLYKRYSEASSCARIIETRDGTRWDQLTLFENRRKPVMLSQAYRASMARASCALCPSPPDTARGRNTSVIGCARALDTSCAKLKGVSASLRGFCQRCGASDNDLRGGATTSRRLSVGEVSLLPAPTPK